jgi:CheY-like chemotaxis protein
LGWARILGAPGTGEEKRGKAVEIIERNARAQAQLIEDMLDISRIITGKMRLDLWPIQPETPIVAAIESLRPVAESKGIRVRTVLDPRAGPILGDSDRLQQVVWNLLSNALKFTPRGGRVEVRLVRINSHVEIEVSDSGEGIVPEFLPYVFDKFRQADASMKRPYGGLGLGLAIVRHLTELHGGTVGASSEGIGKGATFRVTLPVASLAISAEEGFVREDPTAAEAIVPIAFSDELNGLRILVVDDQPDARELMKEVLERSHASVTCVRDAPQAMAALGEAPWDVLLSDIGLPGEDGLALIQKVRKREPPCGGIPAVAITAYARMEDRTSALRAGFDAHLAKPIDPSELVEVVAAVARRGRGAVVARA